MRIKLPKVYPITDTRVSGLSHAKQVELLSRGGATLIQIREKGAGAREFYDEAKAALAVARASQVSLIVNDRVDIALAVKSAGVHLGQSDMPVGGARRLLGDRAIIGFSTHNLEQVELAARMPVNYVALGPIFSTASKKSSDPEVGLAALREARAILNGIPLVAIGGIAITNFEAVLAAGADCVAMLADLLAEPNQITEKTRQVINRAKTANFRR